PELLDTRSEAPVAGQLLDLLLDRVHGLEEGFDLTQPGFGIDLGQVPPDVVDDYVEVPESLVDLLQPQNDLGELAPIGGVGGRRRGTQEQDSQNEPGKPAPSHGVPPAPQVCKALATGLAAASAFAG